MENPEQRALLRRNPDITATAIEEFLRYTSPVTHILRTAKKNGELRGQEDQEWRPRRDLERVGKPRRGGV